MRRYWDERARRNAAWYVDTSLDYDAVDLDRFFATGRTIAAHALDGSPDPVGSGLAVEIGCGLGRVTIALADRFERVIGVDISQEMLTRATAHPSVEFVLGDGSSLRGIADGIADLVLSFTVFQHIPRTSVIERYIDEAGRVLRPGGTFVFQWNNTPGALRWRLRRSAMGVAQRVGLGDSYGRDAPAFLGSRVGLNRITRALEGAGLELRKTDGEGTLYAWAWARKR
jgi:SAM-dependent methyltransferase